MTAAVGLGLLIGVLLGLLGGGGSILAVPALVYGAGVPLSSAVPTSLLVVGLSSAAAVVPRLSAREVHWRIAGVFGAAGVPAAFAGAAVNRLLDPQFLLIGFAALMVTAGVQMLRDRTTVSGACELRGGAMDWRSCLPKAVAAGLVVGFLTGLFGVGGGFLIIPALVLLLGLPMPVAVGTSLLIIVINSGAGFAAHAGADLDYGIAAAFTAAAVFGSLAGTRVSHRLDADQLRRWFAYLVIAVAAFVVAQALLDPDTAVEARLPGPSSKLAGVSVAIAHHREGATGGRVEPTGAVVSTPRNDNRQKGSRSCGVTDPVWAVGCGCSGCSYSLAWCCSSSSPCAHWAAGSPATHPRARVRTAAAAPVRFSMSGTPAAS